MINTNKLSIIVPVYNGEKFILNALESLYKQSVQVDVIIIDDGSTDCTAERVKDFCKEKSNFHYHYQQNGGISAARNKGLSLVQTEYFGFLDADDTVSFDAYEKMLAEIEQTRANICMCNFDWVYSNKRRLAIDTGFQSVASIITEMYATLWNKIYRKSWFDRYDLEFPVGLKYEDASVLYRLALHMDKVCYVKESLIQYNQVEGSITHTFHTNVQDMISVFEGIQDYYQKNGQNYLNELEYVTIRFFLGNNFLRACQIQDARLRKKILELGYNFLLKNYPGFKKNPYLKAKGLKNFYYRMMNPFFYQMSSSIFTLLYKIKK